MTTGKRVLIGIVLVVGLLYVYAIVTGDDPTMWGRTATPASRRRP
jgi:hypothetical protein